ncbi:S8 family serine peptidase [Marinobacterium sp. YM272]|uniref:S8 family serine peptidase n=1 Tax=Marinobacterium sp. YM272 TaxID=3421654 RepID=UPI003D7F6BDB
MIRTTTLLKWGTLFLATTLVNVVVAQNSTGISTRQAKLEALSEKLKQRDLFDKTRAQAFANAMGIPMRRELLEGGVLELQRVRPDGKPVFYITNNIDAADSVSTDEVWPFGSTGFDLDGLGMTLGLWDAGAVFEHPDFHLESNLGLPFRLSQMDDATELSGHSTHVAGTLIGAGQGNYVEATGMAYAADLDAYDWNSDTSEMAAAAASGLLVSNHSYGIAAGWLYLGGTPPDQWWWIGGSDPSDVEDPNFGYYDTESQLWDEIAYDAPYYLIVKAAGNDRSDTGPAPGEEYTVIDQDGSFLFTSTLPREPDCAPAGYDCIPGNSVAKNILTVGAVDDLNGGYAPLSGPGQALMAPFSSWGPTDDGRIKPDLVGNGVFLLSTWHEYPYYAAAAGTSMSAPNVTGSLILLQQHYENLHPGNQMRSATLKALAIHTADETGNDPGPDYAFGWGLLNTKTAAQLITDDGDGNHQIIEDSLASGDVDTYSINVTDPDSVITVTLNWMDPPGIPATPSLDPTDLMLVNDLDLRVINDSDATIYLPWVLDPANPAAAATKGDNFRDNVEQVKIYNAAPGSYTLEVSHKGTLLNNLSQAYSIIVSVTPPLPPSTGILIDEDFSGGLPAGWSIDTPVGTPWAIVDPVPGDDIHTNYVGSGKFALVDNDFNRTVTSLVTPSLDLSGSSGAVLHFTSYFVFYLLETINVDVSIDGGATWTNKWMFYGFNAYPMPHSLDLSAAIAGHSNVKIRFRYDTGGESYGNFWQIDNIQLEAFGGTPEPPPGTPPAAASSPSPADGSNGTGVNTNLSWTTGARTDSHNIYFGTSSPLGSGDMVVNQLSNTFDPGTLDFSTTYYWRVDEVNIDGTTAGATWSFTTQADPTPPPPPPGSNIDPSAAFSYNCTALDCTFDASASTDSDGSISSYSWDFGDDETASGVAPSHTYLSQGNYTVTLTVTDDDSASSTIAASFRVKNRGSVSGSVGDTGSGGGDTTTTIEAEKGKRKCNDGIDNDGDGLIDGDDPDC